jgi:hypothetical protein
MRDSNLNFVPFCNWNPASKKFIAPLSALQVKTLAEG